MLHTSRESRRILFLLLLAFIVDILSRFGNSFFFCVVCCIVNLNPVSFCNQIVYSYKMADYWVSTRIVFYQFCFSEFISYNSLQSNIVSFDKVTFYLLFEVTNNWKLWKELAKGRKLYLNRVKTLFFSISNLYAKN